MITFKIKFDYIDSEYYADVLKIPLANGFPVQWHAFKITPIISDAPETYIFIHDPEKQIFTFELFNHSNKLPNTILNSIKKHCVDFGIPIAE